MKVSIPSGFILGSREAVKEAVAAGIGIGIVLDQERGFDPRLRAITVSDFEIVAGEYLVTRRETRSLGSVAAFSAVASVVAKERSRIAPLGLSGTCRPLM
ncbi:hypothetical protein AB4Z10_09565 [Bosea sp. RAF48]|uniref:hypothetical protein n=1 Tax=Bosea sp. RAF48 TaxID=3237480 RepID=UPI003F92FD1A